MSSSSLFISLTPLLKPLRQLSFFLSLLLIIQFPLTFLADPQINELLVFLVPNTILILFSFAAYRLIKAIPTAFFTPLPIFLAWSSLVFGLGPLYQWLAPNTAERVSTEIFSTDPSGYAWVALLNTVGLFLTVLSLRWFLRFWLLRQQKKAIVPALTSNISLISPVSNQSVFNSGQLVRIGYSAFVLGISFHLWEILLSSAISIPGFLGFIGKANWVAVFFLSIAGARMARQHLVTAGLIAIAEGLQGLIIGMRSEALMPLVIFFTGYYIGSRSLKTLILGVVSIAACLIFISPVVYQVRILTWGGQFQGGGSAAVNEALSQRIEEDSDNDSTIYGIWRRFDYSPWQDAMMSLYDQGKPGDTYRYIPWTFIPRFLVPSKPRFDIGTDIGYGVQGVDQSSSFSGTVFGEMYWNGGWIFVLISSLLYGILLGAVTIGCLWLFSQNTLLSNLMATNGILYGFSSDQSFSVGVVGKAIIFLGLIVAFIFFRDSLSRSRRRGLS